jgi:hypothetical protein
VDWGEVEMSEEIYIKKYGERMNSRIPTRRNLFIDIKPFDGSIENTNGGIRNTILWWDYDLSSNLDPWYKYQVCKYCQRRTKYEHEKFVEGKWVWNRRFCMRHYLIEHFDKITNYDDVILSNRVVEITMSKDSIVLRTGSNSYKYYIEINRRYAILDVDYKGSRYMFRYNNHLNALPYASSYLVLLFNVRYGIINNILRLLEEEIEMIKGRFPCTRLANIYVNGDLFIPACTD